MSNMSVSQHTLLTVRCASYLLATPRLQRLPVRTQVRIDDLGNDVFSKLALEVADIEGGVHRLHVSVHLRALVLVEPAANGRRDASQGRDDGILALVVLLLELSELTEDRVGLLQLVPLLLPR